MEVILTVIPGLLIFGIVWLIIASNKRINNALSSAAETLGFTFISSVAGTVQHYYKDDWKEKMQAFDRCIFKNI